MYETAIDASFIIPVNNESQYKSLEEQLLRKDAFSLFRNIELIPIRGADSIFSAWRKGIEHSKYKYLIFTHQDVSFYNIPDLNKIFLDPKVGMVGPMGSTRISKNKPWCWAEGYGSGRVYADARNKQINEIYIRTEAKDGVLNEDKIPPSYGEVVVLDGICLITTKDRIEAIGGIPHKDYGKWDMYDNIICSEFIKHGFKLLTVPIGIVHHTTGKMRENFYEECKKFSEGYLKE